MNDKRLRSNLRALKRFVRTNGVRALRARTTYSGRPLGPWVQRMRRKRRAGTLPAWLEAELGAIDGFVWDEPDKGAQKQRDAAESGHRKKLAALRDHVERFGWDGFRTTTTHQRQAIGSWVQTQRRRYWLGTLPDWLEGELETLDGFAWTVEYAERSKKSQATRLPGQLKRVRALRRFVRASGWEALASDGRDVEGVDLASWVADVRRRRRSGAVFGDELVQALERIPGWTWDPKAEREQERLAALRDFVQSRGWDALRVGSGGTEHRGVALGRWVSRWRDRHRTGDLDPKTQQTLEAIDGWQWEGKRFASRRKLALLAEYVTEHGWEAFRPGSASVVVDGENLSAWLTNARADYERGTLSAELQEGLTRIAGFEWRFRETYHDRYVEALDELVVAHRSTGRDVVRDIGKLATWIDAVRVQYAAGTLDDEVAERLEAVPGWRWSRR